VDQINNDDYQSLIGPRRGTLFSTTNWSVVLAAGDLSSPEANASLAQLCQTYWFPLYCCVRRHGHPPDDAKDLTQGFFAKLLEKNQLSLPDPERGRFRTFLLRSLENYLRTMHEGQVAQKRGGGREFVSWDAQTAEDRYACEPADQFTPADLFEREWALTLLNNVLERLRLEFETSGRPQLFEALEPHLWGDNTSAPHAQIGTDLGMTTVSVRVTLHRLRQRFGELVRAEIADTLADPLETETELQHLLQIVTL